MQHEISSGSLTAFPHVGDLQRKEGKWKRETKLIHKHLNFHQRKWLVFFVLHRNVEESANHFDFGWKSPLIEVNLNTFKKKYQVANTEAQHLSKTYFHILTWKTVKANSSLQFGTEFFKPHIFTRPRTFSTSSDCQSPLLHYSPGRLCRKSTVKGIGYLYSIGYAYTSKEQVARRRSWALHPWTLQLFSPCLWFGPCLQAQFAPMSPHFWGEGDQTDEVATNLAHMLLDSS